METESNISTEDFPQWAAHRLAVQARNIDTMAGQLKAMRYALIMLIAAHPERHALARKWQAITLQLVDEEMHFLDNDSDTYSHAFQQMLASVAKAVAPDKDQ